MIVVTREDNKAVVRPAGDSIVAASIPELRSKMRDIVEEGVRELVVDLADVQHGRFERHRPADLGLQLPAQGRRPAGRDPRFRRTFWNCSGPCACTSISACPGN